MKMLIYCVKGKPYLFENVECLKDICGKYYTYNHNEGLEDKTLNGKIVAESDFEVEKIKKLNYDCSIITDTLYTDELMNKSCLSYDELEEYLKPNWDKEDNLKNLDVIGYAIHIKNLHIFDEPRELGYYYTRNDDKLKSAPQNMCYCSEWSFNVEKIKENNGCMIKDYILISIRPQWLCKILNGEKTVEIRKKVLKEML